jgi:uncharacterized protein (TIGR04168 family)
MMLSWGRMEQLGRIGIVGDLHGFWDDWDARYFGTTDYDLLLFTGDLGSGTRNDGVRIARSMGRLAKPALVMAGNNDVEFVSEMAAELGHQRGLSALVRATPSSPISGLGSASGQVRMCGYSMHPLTLAGREVALVAGRPHAMGGGELSFPHRLKERYGVTSMAESTERLCALVDQVPCADVIFLGHNGPEGLGDDPADLWGCDFKPGVRADWGDPDLRAAVARARARGLNVRAVIAGHMHRAPHDDAREITRVVDGTLYLNPARVPRIFSRREAGVRHHVLLELGAQTVSAREVLVEDERS